MYYFHGKAIGGMEFVRCTEVVRLSESPLLEVSLYFYGKSNRGHGICPLYRGCPPLGESVIRGFTVLYYYFMLSH